MNNPVTYITETKIRGFYCICVGSDTKNIPLEQVYFIV